MKEKLQVTPTTRRYIVMEIEKGRSTRDLAKEIGKHHSTVARVYNKYSKTRDWYYNSPKPGRPRILTKADEKYAALLMERHQFKTATDMTHTIFPYVSVRTIRRALNRQNLHSFRMRKKPLLKKRSFRLRKLWAKRFRFWTVNQWRRVIFSDETQINLFGNNGPQQCYRRKGQAYLAQNIQKTVKYGGGSIMVWGCMTSKGLGRLIRIDGIMDRYKYIKIIKEGLLGTLRDYRIQKNAFLFQQDNDPKHKSRYAMSWFQKNRIHLFDWPAWSADMNIIEHVWNQIKYRIRRRRRLPTNKDALFAIFKEEWENFDFTSVDNLYKSLPLCLQTLLKAKGGYTKY